jgi:hypothetical protein
MDGGIGPRRESHVEHRSDDAEIWRRDQLKRETPLPWSTALIVIVALSLGLWWVIWLAVSVLASGVHG